MTPDERGRLMETWTWWPRGPAERLLRLPVEAKDWDGLAGLAPCLPEMLRERGSFEVGARR